MDVKMGPILFCVFLIPILFTDVYSYEECKSYSLYSYSYTTYCKDGYYCCDDDTDCCPDSVLTVGAIVGIVIGSIVFITCCVGGICVCVKMANRPARNVAPVPVQHTGMAVISQGYQPPYNQQQPPPYNQQQPPYNQQQPPYNQQQPLQPSASNGQFSTPYGYGGQQSSSVEKPEKFDSAVPPVATVSYRNP